MKNNKLFLTGIFIACFTMVAGCQTTPEQRAAKQAAKEKARAAKLEKKRQATIKKLNILKDGEFYVVGRIEVTPKIKEEEQNLKTLGSKRLKGKIHAFFSNQFVDIREQSFGIIKHVSEVPLYEDFIIKRRKSDKLFYSGGSIWLESAASYSGHMNKQTTVHMGKLHLPGDLVYKLKPGDKAVYVGTIRYYRDEYNAIKKVKYINQYSNANKVFKKTIKDQTIKLRRVKPKTQKGVW
ncbi:MAG: hypothetical protein ABFS08_12505 [Pseudomonadota bacterium]